MIPSRILVVDDNRSNQVVLRALLDADRSERLEQLEVTFASSGQEALEAIEHEEFAVILLDIRMPGMDGFETARHIKAHATARSTPIIFVTANEGTREEIKEAYARGGVDYLTKPFEPEVIRAKISVFVDLFRKTLQVREQASLQRSEEHFRLLAEAIPQLVWTATSDGTLDYRNHAWADYVGHDLSDSTPADRARLVHPDDAIATAERWKHARESGEPFEIVYRLRRSDGVYRSFLARAVPLRESSGRIVKWFGTCTDVTDEKRAFDALQLSEQRLQAILDSATSAIYLKDLEGRHILVNQEYEKVTGRSRSELIDRPDELVVGKEPVRAFRDADRKVAASGHPLQMEHTFARHGEDRTYLTVKFPVRDGAGKIYAIGGIWTDITERRRAEDRLRFLSDASKALATSLDVTETLQIIAKNAVPRLGDGCAIEMKVGEDGSEQIAVAHVDEKKVELAWELRRRYPLRHDAPFGVPAVLRSGQSELYPEITDAMMVSDTIDEEHLRITRELGLKSVLIVPIRVGDKTLGAFTLVSAGSGRIYNARDQSLAEELGIRAGFAIENARLYEQAQKAIRVRDEFLSVASHELKTPLTSMRLQLAAVARSSEGAVSRVHDTVRRAQLGLDRLARLVEELLDVSRISAGRLVLSCAPLDLATLVQEVLASLGDEWQRSGCEVTFNGTGDSRGSWDASRLEQIVTNLVVNACKFGKGRPVSVGVAADESAVRLVVTDHGIGISKEDQARIFDRFERAVSSRHYGGLGLGLWISRQIVEAHAGTIQVESTIGEGATFTVTLPRT